MFTHKNLMTVCCAAVLAFGLAACGSSSDDVKVMDTVVDKKPLTPVVPEEQPPTDDDIAAKTKEAATKETAIAMEAGQTTIGGLGGRNAEGVALDTYSMTIARDGDGTTVTITVDGAMDDSEFIMQDVDLEQFEKNGFSSTMHVLKMDADEDGNVVEEVVIVSTDIDVPTDIPFAKANAADTKGRYFLDANPETTGEEDNQSLSFNADADEGHVGLAMLTDSRVAVPAPDGRVTLMGDNVDTEDVKENEYSGTFDGAEGTFTCTDATACVVTVVDGEITTMVDVHFTPDEEDVMVKEDDADYLNYGFWLKRTTDEDGVLTYNEVETFAGSLIPATTSVEAVEGTAEYDGGATGVYVKNVYNPDRTIASATSGFFTANVYLKAFFGGPDVTTRQENSVTGTIDQFVLQHGEENMWSVDLEGDIAPSPATASGTTDGGGDEGSFNAIFHGPTPETEATDDQQATVAPGAVVGEFNANFSDGTAAGGFGARK